jgi:hypothetical protein
VLIVRSKTVVIDGRPIKLFSLDGKLWFNKPHDFPEYKQRRASVKTTLQHVFALRVLSEPIASGAADYWGR